ncbi:MAG: hypothetical protein M1837_000098 [Sclerophora amabilis]|nr:MAG: hypothetical protein M1837_000098 [Sclerophora amabilis]
MSAPQEDQASGSMGESGGQAPSVPRLGEGFADARTSTADLEEDQREASDDATPVAKSSKRRLFGFGRKKEDGDKNKKKAPSETGTGLKSPPSPLQSSSIAKAMPSPHRSSHPYEASSPKQRPTSSSPGLPSPASSQIFERDVQESAPLAPTSPAIPGHIQTENHIPPVLEASSIAITDGHLNPDNVEIVTHPAHQPAAVNVTGTGNGEEAPAHSMLEDNSPHPDHDDGASNYGSLDANDFRRLSFISFADVVQAEHTEHSNSRDSVHLAGMSTSASPPPPTINRSPSPARSPGSSHALGHSPPLSGSASIKGLDGSPGRSPRGPGSPVSITSNPAGGELTIETMRQALRKTGSGDLGAARGQPLGPGSIDDGASDRQWR